MLDKPKIMIMLILGVWLIIGTSASKNNVEDEKRFCCKKSKEKIELKQKDLKIQQKDLEIEKKENELNEAKKRINDVDTEYLSEIDRMEKILKEKSEQLEKIDKLIMDEENKVKRKSMTNDYQTKHKVEIDKIISDEDTGIVLDEMKLLKMKNARLESQNQSLITEIGQYKISLAQSHQTKLLDPTCIPGKAIVRLIVTHKMRNYRAVGMIRDISDIIQKFLSPFGVSTIFHNNMNFFLPPFGYEGRYCGAHKYPDIRAIRLCHDNRFLFIAGASNRISVWDLETGVCIRQLSGMIGSSFQLSNDDQVLLIQNIYGGVCVLQQTWNASLGKYSTERIDAIEKWRGLDLGVEPVLLPALNYTFSQDNQYLLAHRDTNRITAWILSSGAHYRDFYFNLELRPVPVDPRNFLAVTNAGQYIIAVTECPNTTITVWDFWTGELKNEKRFYGTRNGIYACCGNIAVHCITRDQKWIILATERTNYVNILNLPQMDKVYRIEPIYQKIGTCTEGQDPDTHNHVVAVSSKFTGEFPIYVWSYLSDFSRGQKIHQLDAFGGFCACSLTSDGRVLIGAGRDSIQLWNTSTGKLYDYYDTSTKTATHTNTEDD